MYALPGTPDADPGEPSEGFHRLGGTVRVLAGLVAAVMMATVVTVAPAWARIVRLKTVVSLTDRSDPAVKAALREAFDTSLRGAIAMGFARIRVDAIRVLQDTVVVLATVATDGDDDDQALESTRDQ